MATRNIYRITSNELLETLENWDRVINFRLHLIACGGTALTLYGWKESTKDIDFMIPLEKEFPRLIKFIRSIGYREAPGGWANPDDPFFIYQFWSGNWVFTTELLQSPLKTANHVQIKKWGRIYLGALNPTDLIISKIFRGTTADIQDCAVAFEKGYVDPQSLMDRFHETALYDLTPVEKLRNLFWFFQELSDKDMVQEIFLDKTERLIWKENSS